MYQNEQIYTQAKKFFKSKDFFTYQDILDWLNENEEEYNKIYNHSIGCNGCGVLVKNYKVFPNHIHFCKSKPTEEYKFYDFYKKIIALTEFKVKNTIAKVKLQEYERIINDDEKVRNWLIKNEEDYYSFWKNNSPHFVDTGSKLLYYFRENDVAEYTKFFVERTNFEYSVALSNLLNVLYPEGWEVYTYGHIIAEDREKINFSNANLKIFTEKDTFSLEELSTWLEENREAKELTSVRYSIDERFESVVVEGIKNSLNCSLDAFQKLIEDAKNICKLKDNKSVRNMTEAFDLDLPQPQIGNKHLLYSVVNEIKETGTYVIHQEDWITIKISSEELTPLLRVIDEFNISENSEDIPSVPF